jgi:hypothetical protein
MIIGEASEWVLEGRFQRSEEKLLSSYCSFCLVLSHSHKKGPESGEVRNKGPEQKG